jgi:hypothetical protein
MSSRRATLLDDVFYSRGVGRWKRVRAGRGDWRGLGVVAVGSSDASINWSTAALTRRARTSSGTSRPAPTFRSKCHRFLAVFGSGTCWNHTRGPRPAGSTIDSGMSPAPGPERHHSLRFGAVNRQMHAHVHA